MGALDENPQVLRVRRHLVEHLGAPKAVFEVSGSPLADSPVQTLNLAYFCPQGADAPVVFATCGASLFEMKDGRRVEGLVLLHKEPDAAAFASVQRLLGSFALFAESNDEAIQVNDVLHVPDDLTAFCAMDAVLLIPPVPFVPTFHRLSVAESAEVELLWLLPVYASEVEYALEHGPQATIMLFAAQGLNMSDPQRPEADTQISPGEAEAAARRVLEENQASDPGSPDISPSRPRPIKPKSSRREIEPGSFDVSPTRGKIRVTRGGQGKKHDHPGSTPPAESSSDGSGPDTRARPVGPSGPNSTPKTAHGPPPRAGPHPPPHEVRFDLSDGVTGTRPDPHRRAGRDPKRRPASEMTPEERAAAKQKRIADLKQRARETAEAVARQNKNEE